MPWTKSNYPDSMKNLPKEVREKAIEIANAVLEEKQMDEGIAIATGISRAKDWAVNHGKKAESGKEKTTTDVKQHGEDRYVVPQKDGGWAIKKEAANRLEKGFDNKQEAIQQAREEAKKANATVTIQKRTGGIEKRTSYNPNNKGRKKK